MADAFYVAESDDTFVATPLSTGPWDERFQHGGPPSALLAGAIASFGDDANEFEMARLWVDFRRGVPVGRLTVTVAPLHRGRTTQRIHAALVHQGKVVLEAQGLRIRRRGEGPTAVPPLEAWPDPESVERTILKFFTAEVAYHNAVDLRFVDNPWGSTPNRVWGRLLVPLVAGRPTTPLERLITLADAQSGLGPPVDPIKWNYANPDLTVYVDRPPEGEWIGFDLLSTARPSGLGLSQALIRDATGACGRSAQSLIVSPRTVE